MGPDSTTDKIEFRRLKLTPMLRLFWDKRRTIACIVTAGMLLSAIYAFLLTPMYTSTTTLMPPENAQATANLTSLASGSGPGGAISSALLGGRNPGALFVGILGSRTVRERLATGLDLVRYYRVQGTDDACRQLAENTLVTLDTKSGIVTVSVKDPNPQVASKIARGYATELDQIVTQNSTSAARRERIFLEGRLKQIKQDLDDSSKALSQFSAKNRTIDIPAQAKAMVEAGLKLHAELTVARSELAGLRQAYSGDNLRVRAAVARIEELENQIGEIEGASGVGSSKRRTGVSTYPSIVELPGLGLTYADLDRNVRVEEALWETLTRQYEMAKVQEAKEIPTVRVLDVANVPQHKSSPVRSVILLLGALASVAAGCLFVIGKRAWDNMLPQDDRKLLLNDVIACLLPSLEWLWLLPRIKRGQEHLQARL